MKRKVLISILALLTVPGIAIAQQDQGGDVSLEGDLGLFTLRAGNTLDRGQWSFGTYLNLWNRRTPGVPGADPLWNSWDYDYQRLSAAFGYGVTDRFNLTLMVPYDDFEGDGSEGPFLNYGALNGLPSRGDFDRSGLGNVRLGAKWQLTENQYGGFALNAFVDFATGDDDEGVVTGETGFGVGLAYSHGGWVVNAGFLDPGDNDGATFNAADFVPSGPFVPNPRAATDVSPQVTLGVGYAHGLSERFDWITELVGAVKTDGDEEHDDADLTSGVRYRFGDDLSWAFNAGLRVDLAGTDDLGGLLGLTYASRPMRTLTVEKTGAGGGSVVSDPEGIDCGAACIAEYRKNTRVDLVATPDASSYFAGWGGDCPGGTVTMDDDKLCSARFEPVYTLTVRKDGGEGRVTSTPDGIDCGAACSARYNAGTAVKLTAQPADGFTFEGWSGDCGADGAVTMDADKGCTATFKVKYPPLPPPQGSFITCVWPEPGKGKKKARISYACDAGARETATFDRDAATLSEDQQRRLCDLAEQLRHCGQLSACIAGRVSDGENPGLEALRGNAVADFLHTQGVPSASYQTTPDCSAERGSGTRTDIFLE